MPVKPFTRRRRGRGTRRWTGIWALGLALAALGLRPTVGPTARAEPPKAPPGADPRTGVTWVKIPGGRFQMGSNEDDTEKPVHRVTVRAFWMSRSEVTVAQYRRCVQAGKCTAPGAPVATEKDRRFCNWGVAGRDDHPVNCVDWEQAKAYATWAGGRLPSEAEWEYAARGGGRSQKYPWGDEVPSCERVVMDGGGPGCGKSSTGAVCSKPAGNTVHGLCDLAGNVLEWVLDWYHDSHVKAPINGSAREGKSEEGRAMRGSSFFTKDATYHRSTSRAYGGPRGFHHHEFGFRIARSH